MQREEVDALEPQHARAVRRLYLRGPRNDRLGVAQIGQRAYDSQRVFRQRPARRGDLHVHGRVQPGEAGGERCAHGVVHESKRQPRDDAQHEHGHDDQRLRRGAAHPPDDEGIEQRLADHRGMGVPVVVEDVQKTYPGEERVTALAGVSLEVRRGEMVALMGPSGCGKSTLLGLIGVQDRPSSGKILLDGVPTSDLDEAAMAKMRRERVGMVFQSFNLLDSLSVLDNVALPLILQGREEGEFSKAALAMLDAVGMAPRARARPSELSGGQQQRVAIARALVHAPAVLLADEATGNLDSATAESILTLLREVADSGQAILIATHSAEVAERCDRIMRMRDGVIVA